MLNENEVNNEMNSDVIADVNNDVNHEGNAMSEVNDVNGEVNNEVEVNNEEIEVSNEMNSNEVNNEEIEMSDEESNAALEAVDEVQQDGNENRVVLDSESKVGELVDDAFTKKGNMFDNVLIPANEAELMNVPYRSIPGYFTLLYLEEAKPGHNSARIIAQKTNNLMGMHSHERSAVSQNLNFDDIHASPFVITAYVESEKRNSFGLLLKYVDKIGRKRLLYLSMADIDDGKYIRVLNQNAFYIGDDDRFHKRFRKYLKNWRLKVDYIVPYVEKLGYSEAHHGFFMADGLHLANSKKYIWFNSFDENYTPKGTYEAWYENIAKEVVKYPLTSFSMICAFAAYLLQILDLNTMFFHFGGRGSKGKTMLLQLATSVHANGSDPGGNSFIKTWNSSKESCR